MRVAEAVDLGLSVKWASWNVGASTPEDFGNYYAWGEIEPKMFYQIVNYSLEKYRTYDGEWSGVPHYFRSSFPKNIAGNSEYDVATAKWGSGWAMPTKAQFEELLSKCSHGPTTSNGVKGELFVGPKNKTIFLPYCGYRTNEDKKVGEKMYYWSSTLERNLLDHVGWMYGNVPLCTDGIFGLEYVWDASTGLPVRPVKK